MELINVMAASLDGRIGGQSLEGDSVRQASGLSSASDQRHLRDLIESAEAVVVGASSIRANQECLDHPGKSGQAPSWFVMCQKGIPEDYAFWQQKHIPRYLISAKGLRIPTGHEDVESLAYGSQDPANFVYNELQNRGFQRVLLFGGGIINRMFYQKGLVDRLSLTLSPIFIARHDAPYLIQPDLDLSVRFKLESLGHEGDYIFADYSVLRASGRTQQT
ncbi:MAG: RibD family protein [Oligoflexus sp.]